MFLFFAQAPFKIQSRRVFSTVDYQQGASQLLQEVLGPLKRGDFLLPM